MKNTFREVLTSSRGRVGFGLVLLALVIAGLSFCGTARAGVGLTAMKEITHDESTPALFIDYTAPRWSAYAGQWNSRQFGGDTRVMAAEYRFHVGPFFAGIGPAYLDQITALNGTRLNFSVTVGVQWRRWAALCRHYSHGRQLGIAEDKDNGGWNFCGGRRGF